jgi:hypothetical protein
MKKLAAASRSLKKVRGLGKDCTMPSRIVTHVHRPKRPPRKRKAVAIMGPAIVTKASRRAPADTPPVDDEPEPAAPPPANDDSPAEPAPPAAKSAIVTPRRRGKRNADVPDMTPEEFQRRADAAHALWLELVRSATGKDRP